MEWLRSLAFLIWIAAPVAALNFLLRRHRTRTNQLQKHAYGAGLNFRSLSSDDSLGLKMLQQMQVAGCTVHSIVELQAFEPFRSKGYGEISNLVSGTWNSMRIICFDHVSRFKTGHALSGKGFVAVQLPIAVPMTTIKRAGAVDHFVRFVDKGYESFWGPGRHRMGSIWFWYFNSPFGCHVEYDADMDLHDASWIARAVPIGADNSQLFLFSAREKWFPGGPPEKH